MSFWDLDQLFFPHKKGETIYSLRLFPLGGAVVMEGEDDSSDERAFNKKTFVAEIFWWYLQVL